MKSMSCFIMAFKKAILKMISWSTEIMTQSMTLLLLSVVLVHGAIALFIFEFLHVLLVRFDN